MTKGLNYLQLLGENKKSFSKCQYKRALVARKLYHTVGAPSLQIFKMMIRHNIIHNYPVTVDIDMVDKTFGLYVSNLRGIITRQRPKLVVDEFIEIPSELIENNQ